MFFFYSFDIQQAYLYIKRCNVMIRKLNCVWIANYVSFDIFSFFKQLRSNVQEHIRRKHDKENSLTSFPSLIFFPSFLCVIYLTFSFCRLKKLFKCYLHTKYSWISSLNCFSCCTEIHWHNSSICITIYIS